MDDKSEVVNLVLLEGAFFRPEIEIVLLETFEDFVYDFLMFGDVARSDENVIEINGNFAFRDEIGENGVHKCLERGGRVSETEEHNFRFE